MHDLRPLDVLRFIFRSSKRIAVTAVGAALVLAGLAMLVLPGPGILVVVAGFAVLGTEYAWAARALDRTKRAAETAGKVAKNSVGSAGRVAKDAAGSAGRVAKGSVDAAGRVAKGSVDAAGRVAKGSVGSAGRVAKDAAGTAADRVRGRRSSGPG